MRKKLLAILSRSGQTIPQKIYCRAEFVSHSWSPNVPGPVSLDELYDWMKEANPREVVEATDPNRDLVQPSISDPIPKPTEVTNTNFLQPKKFLRGWGEILKHLKKDDSEEERRGFKRLSKMYDGPLHGGGSGGKVTVEESVLNMWINTVLERQAELALRRANQKASTADSHNWGKTAEVIPDLNGSIKRRRAKKQTKAD